MIQNTHLIKLIEAFRTGDVESADYIIRELIRNTEKKKQYKVAKELRRVYSLPESGGGSTRESHKFSASSLFVEKEEHQKLFEIRSSKIKLENIVLSERNLEIFEEIKTNFLKKDLLQEHGLSNDSHILLYGPPGTGKTLFAYVLAGELKLPIIHVYLDVLISSYLGETGKNLKLIFKEAMSRDCILFLDEFDAIGKHRDDTQELGELKRVVTVLLQNIDELSTNTILVAATNHEHLLDPAIWRRFEYQLNIDILDKGARASLFRLFLREYIDIDFDMLSGISEGFSGAIIRQVINKSLRKKVLENDSDIEKLLVQEIMLVLARVKQLSKDKNRDNFIKAVNILRKIDAKTYTFDYVEKISGVPSSTIHHLVKNYGS